MSAPVDPSDRRRHRHRRLRFVCVNDVYSFDDLDGGSAGGSPRGGWCRAATVMKRLRQEPSSAESEPDETVDSDTTVLTVANGDVLGGSSLLVNCQGSVAVEVMNSIPIDAAVLGNHEFDYGDEALMRRVEESEFSWLGSNVYYPKVSGSDPQLNNLAQERVASSGSLGDDRHYFPGIDGNGKMYDLSNGLKLGVFGLVTKSTPKISRPSDKVVFDSDIISVARRTAQLLRAQGAQVVVAITHLCEAEDRLLASDRIAGVDLILGGHEHEPLAAMVHRDEREDDADAGGQNGGTGEQDREQDDDAKHNEGGVLVFKCGMNAYWVGSVDLDVSLENERVTSISTTWSMNAVNARIREDPTASRIVKRCRKETDEAAMVSSFGNAIASTLNLDDAIAKVGSADDNGSTQALPLDTRMSSVRRREATGGNLVADAMHWMLEANIDEEKSSLPMLAMINGGFIRGDRVYKHGSIFSVREILKELPFPRTMKVLEIEGRHLRDAMAQQLKGSSRGPTGAYPHLSSNARFAYGLGGADGSDSADDDSYHVRSFWVNGLEVSDSQKYLIAVTCFVADGNEGCTYWLSGERICNPAWEGINMACVLLKYLQCHPVIRPVLEGRVRLER